MRNIRGAMYNVVYDYFHADFTAELYRDFIDSIPANSTVLDIGIGTGTALMRNRDMIKQKNIKIYGVDIDIDYVARCRNVIERNDMSEYVQIRQQDVMKLSNRHKFDYVLYSDSYAVIDNVHDMIDHTRQYLNKDGKIVVITTLDNEACKFRDYIKSHIKYVTSIELGHQKLYDDFVEAVRDNYTYEMYGVYWGSYPIYGEFITYRAILSPRGD